MFPLYRKKAEEACYILLCYYVQHDGIRFTEVKLQQPYTNGIHEVNCTTRPYHNSSASLNSQERNTGWALDETLTLSKKKDKSQPSKPLSLKAFFLFTSHSPAPCTAAAMDADASSSVRFFCTVLKASIISPSSQSL